MRYVDCIDEIVGGIVVDSCGTVLLPCGEEVVWRGMINPEWKGKRKFLEWDTDKGIELPLDFAI